MLSPLSLQAAQNQLALFAAQSNFDAVMTTAFGNRMSRTKLQLIRQQWLSGNFSVIPDIQVLSQGELGGANGAYAASLDKIFISSDFLARASESQVTTLILEEVGHRLDQLLNGGVDSAGDEGEIFSRLVNGQKLLVEMIAIVKEENDHGLILIEGVTITIEKQDSTIIGTIGDDKLIGDVGGVSGNDIISGLGGDDTLQGKNGNDYLVGGDGNDYIYGGDGKSTLDGGAGNDNLSGGNGWDYLLGGDGNDYLYGEGGNDYLVGGNGDDVLLSDYFFDTNNAGNDYLYGGDGNDYLVGWYGND
jgi:Ca2+-binding RTX toxin-like protein